MRFKFDGSEYEVDERSVNEMDQELIRLVRKRRVVSIFIRVVLFSLLGLGMVAGTCKDRGPGSYDCMDWRLLVMVILFYSSGSVVWFALPVIGFFLWVLVLVWGASRYVKSGGRIDEILDSLDVEQTSNSGKGE